MWMPCEMLLASILVLIQLAHIAWVLHEGKKGQEQNKKEQKHFKVWLPFEAEFSIQKVQDSKPFPPGPHRMTPSELKGSDCTMLTSEMVACFQKKKENRKEMTGLYG